LLFPEGGDFTVLGCSRCGALVAFHTQRAFSPLPHVEPELSYQRLALSSELRDWLGSFPRYVPYTAPSVFMAASTRVADASELEQAEAAARTAQAPLDVVQRLEQAGVPEPHDEVTPPSLAAFQDVARLVSAAVTFGELLSASARGARLLADIASQKLADRPTLAGDLAALIRAGGKTATEASRAVFRLRPTDSATRRDVAGALATRLLELCNGSPFAAEAELSDHMLALLTLGADAEPAREVLPALRGCQLFPLRSLLRDQVAKLERTLG